MSVAVTRLCEGSWDVECHFCPWHEFDFPTKEEANAAADDHLRHCAGSLFGQEGGA